MARRSRPPALPSPARHSLPVTWLAGAIALACLITYSNGLSGPFVYDDELSVVENRHIRELGQLGAVLSAEQDSPTAGRPLVNLSFALNYATSGLDVRAYHVTNLVIHILCALMLFGIGRRTLLLPSLNGAVGATASHVAFAIALIWAVHPLNSEVVEYVTQRTESMMALCYLATLYASVRAIGSRRPARWQAVAVGSCALGMACKESMATAPIAVVLYDSVYVFESLKRAWLKRWRFYLGLSTTWVVLAVLMSSNPRGESAGFASGVDPWTYLLNQTIIIAEYLQRAFWPRSLVAGYGWVQPLTLPDVVPYAVLLAVMLLFAAGALIAKPKLGFLGAWFFVALSPTSSVVPIPIEVGAERRMYLPLVALVTLAVIGALAFFERLERRFADRPGTSGIRPWRHGRATALTVIAAALSAGTMARNHEYASGLSLYRTVVERWPTSLSHHILGSALMTAGSHEEALAELRAALPGAPRAHYDLGVELFNAGKFDEAIMHLEALIDIWESPPVSHPYWQAPVRGDVVEARLILGRAFAQQQRWADASREFEQVLTMVPAHLETHKLLATSLFSAGRFEEAVAHYEKYLATRSDDVDALTNLAIALVSAGRNDEAVRQFRRAVDADPANGRSRRNLANALFDAREIDEAAVHAAQAVSLRPDDPAAIDLLGQVLAVQGKRREATLQFERALQLDPGYEKARDHLELLRR